MRSEEPGWQRDPWHWANRRGAVGVRPSPVTVPGRSKVQLYEHSRIRQASLHVSPCCDRRRSHSGGLVKLRPMAAASRHQEKLTSITHSVMASRLALTWKLWITTD